MASVPGAPSSPPPAIPLVHDTSVRYGEVERLGPTLRRVVANNPGPFTYTGTGVYIIGAGPLAIIDPGPDDPAHVDALLRAIGEDRLTHIFVTHNHRDHCPAARPLAEATGAPIYAFAGPQGAASSEAEPQNIVEEGTDRSFRPDVAIGHGEAFSGHGWTLEAVHTPGHTANHLCFALREEQALFTGDHIMGWATTVVAPPDGRMADYMRSLQLLLGRDDEIYWPTHGPPIRNPKAFVRAVLMHRRMRDAQILDQIRGGRTTVKEMVPVMYAATDKRLHPAAALSVYAHLIGLKEQGLVTCEGEALMTSAYALA